jgi:DNA-binding NtrC family response regulator
VEEVEAAVSSQLLRAEAAAAENLAYDMPLREAREQFEKQYLAHQLQEVGGSVGKLAKRVGMERTHLYRKLRGLGIEFKKGGD